MLSWLRRRPERQLQKAYERKLAEALHFQRNGDMRGCALVTAEAEQIRERLEALRNPRT